MNSSEEMAAIMTEALWHIDAETEKEGWDQPPQLYAVAISPAQDGMGVIALQPAAGWEACKRVTESAAEALDAMAHVLAAASKELLSETYPDVYGFAFVTEAWMLRGPKVDGEIPAELMQVGYEHKIHLHPDRFEVRFTYFVSKDGKVAALNHERDGIVQEIKHGGPISLGGSIPTLLARCVKELK